MDEKLYERINHPRGEPKLWGQRAFDAADGLVVRMDRAVEQVLPARFNPFAQTGAIATVSFLVAAVTGILLLIWYRPSVHQAYDSVLAMEAVWIGEFIRSLHRYSSDVCVFFVVIHALRLFFAGRFTGARWLAWVSGVALIATLWFVGWTGYILVWDEPAQLAAQGSALFLDLLPIFAEPVSRAFLADELVPSLLFFVIFFTHMLVPLVMAVGLWIHVTRVQRAKVLTSKWMSVWTVGALVVLSIAVPATAGDPANLQTVPESITIDAWYLAPLWVTDRLGAGMLWALVAIGGGLLLAAPWLLRREKPQVATLNTKACNGCTLCARDCPYDAIVMVPRTDGRRYKLQAKLDPQRCVGCGICAGSCNPGGIGLSWLPVQAMRKRFDGWIDQFIEESEDDQGPVLAFLCSGSVGKRFDVDEETGECAQLEGYRVVNVPCTGWVQPLTVERALRRGAAGVLIVGCSESEPHFREGHRWTERRMTATRKPKLRREKIEAWRVQQMVYDRSRPEEFVEEAKNFRTRVGGGSEADAEITEERPTGRMIAGGVVLATLLAGVVTAGSMMPYPGPPEEDPRLVVSVNHYTQLEEECVPIPEEERANQPIHMQQTERCERGRADLLVEVSIDGEVVYEETHQPRGLTGDGPAVTLDRLEVEPGEREVRVRIADNIAGDWSFEERWRLHFQRGQQQVLLFDTDDGFRHFGPDGG